MYGKIYEHNLLVSLDQLYVDEVLDILDNLTYVLNRYDPDTRTVGTKRLRDCFISPSRHPDYLVIEGDIPLPLYTLISLPGGWSVEFVPDNTPHTTE